MFISSWSTGKNKVVYQEGCYNCDGPRTGTFVYDTSSNKNTEIISGVKGFDLNAVVASDDFTKVTYVESTANPNLAGEALDGGSGAPYKINLLNLKTGKTTLVATIGTKNEKNSNGTYKYRFILAGKVLGTDKFYYTDGEKQLFTFSTSSITPSLAFSAGKNIYEVPLVAVNTTGDGQIVFAGYGKDTSDYTLASYDTKTKKSVTIFQGDNNTVIFGVTTK